MKNCQFCQAELEDHAMFCSQCGNRQEPAETAAVPPPVVQAAAPVPFPGQEVQPPLPPKPPSELALEGKRYLSWLTGGFLGTQEPIHFLYAAIVPFLVALVYTLSSARFMGWHAGGFFLLWFFNMIMVLALPATAWLLKRFWLKEEADIKATFSHFSSLSNVILAAAFLVMILGLAGAGIALTLGQIVPVLIFAASVLLVQPSLKNDLKKMWLATLILAGVFIVLLIIWNSILSAGVTWGFGRLFF